MRRLVDGVGLGCVVLSGAAAMGHELLWTRRLVDLLGGASEANTRVLSLFFLGLALGAMIAHSWLPRLQRPWRTVALAEFAVAVLALPALYLSGLRDWLWAELAIGAGNGATIKLAVSVLVVLPPSVAMGVTLPCFVTALLSTSRRLSRWGMTVYALNTLGGLLGLLGVALILLPTYGATFSMGLLGGSNFLLAIVCLTMDALEPRPSAVVGGQVGAPSHQDTPATVTATTPEATRRTAAAAEHKVEAVGATTHRPPVWYGQNGVWLWMAFFSGFGLLAFEIVGLQLIMLVAPLSFHAPTAILSVVIMMLVIGACVATGLTRNWGRGHDPALGQRWMLRSLMGTGVALILTAPWFFWLSPRIGTDSAPSLPVFLGQVMGLATLAFGPALLFAGQLFPLTFLAYSREQGDLGGRSWAWLLAANGIGGLLGAEFAYRLLLPSLGVNSSIAALGLLYLGSGWLVSQMRQDWEGDRMGRWMAALCGGVIVTWGWVAQLPEVNPYLGFKVVHQQAGAEGSLAIVERADFGRAILVSNQYLLGSTGAMADQRRQTHLPLLLHPAPKNVAFVGLATGITPGAALQDPVVDQVTAVEISRSVVHVAQAYFAAENLGIVDHPRARVIVEDGRTYIASQEEAYDVIVGDLYLPWAAGASRLYSVEHFAACRRALRSGGLFCQWLPMHQLTEPQLRRIVASYRVAFPDVHLIVNSFSARAPALGLVGWRDGDWDWQTIESRCRQARLGSEMTQPSLRYREGVAMHYLGRLSPGDLDAAPITLDNLWLELDAGRRQVTGKYVAQTEPYLANQTWRDWFAAAQIGQCSVVRSDAWTARRQLTHELLEWEAQLQNKDPNASLNGRRFKEQFPEPWWLEIRTWGRQWPGPNPIPN